MITLLSFDVAVRHNFTIVEVNRGVVDTYHKIFIDRCNEMNRAARRTVSAYGRINTAVYDINLTLTRTVKGKTEPTYGTVRVVLR